MPLRVSRKRKLRPSLLGDAASSDGPLSRAPSGAVTSAALPAGCSTASDPGQDALPEPGYEPCNGNLALTSPPLPPAKRPRPAWGAADPPGGGGGGGTLEGPGSGLGFSTMRSAFAPPLPARQSRMGPVRDADPDYQPGLGLESTSAARPAFLARLDAAGGGDQGPESPMGSAGGAAPPASGACSRKRRNAVALTAAALQAAREGAGHDASACAALALARMSSGQSCGGGDDGHDLGFWPLPRSEAPSPEASAGGRAPRARAPRGKPSGRVSNPRKGSNRSSGGGGGGGVRQRAAAAAAGAVMLPAAALVPKMVRSRALRRDMA